MKRFAATNNDPGTWNIQFAPALKGSTIGGQGMPYLNGGNVTINGDIDGDGQPDITLGGSSGSPLTLYILSGGITRMPASCLLLSMANPSSHLPAPPWQRGTPGTIC